MEPSRGHGPLRILIGLALLLLATSLHADEAEPLYALDADNLSTQADQLAAWRALEGFAGWVPSEIKVNVAAAALGGVVRPETSRETERVSSAHLNDGLSSVVDPKNWDRCAICGWLADKESSKSYIDVSFAGGAPTDLNAVVLDTHLRKFGPFPYFFVPTSVDILARAQGDAGFLKVVSAKIGRAGARALIPLPPGLRAAEVRIVIPGTHFDHKPALAEIEVWEDVERAGASITQAVAADLTSPALGGMLLSFTGFHQRPASKVVLGKAGDWWQSQGQELPQDFVFAFREYQSVFLDRVVLEMPADAPPGLLPARVSVEVTHQDTLDAMRSVAEVSLDPALSQVDIPLYRDATLVRLRILARRDPEARHTALGKIALIEGRRAGYTPLHLRPRSEDDATGLGAFSAVAGTGTESVGQTVTNGTLTTAIPLDEGQEEHGITESFQDVHYFRLPPVPEGATALTVTLNSVPDIRHRLDLLDDGGNQLATFIPSGVLSTSARLNFALDPQPAALRLRQSPVSSVLVWDTSGSMDGAEAALEDAVRSFISDLPDWHDLQLVRFSDEVEVLTEDFMSDRGLLTATLEGKFEPSGGTRLFDAVDSALNLLADRTGRRNVILFGDGFDSASKMAYGQYWSRIRDSDVRFYAIGLGEDFTSYSLNFAGTGLQLFDSIARETDGRLYYSAESGSLMGFFREIARDLSQPIGYAVTMHYARGFGHLAVHTTGDDLPLDSLPATHVIFDVSGSMSTRLATGERRIDAGKAAFREVLGSVPEGSPFGLTVYGARVPESSGKAKACEDIQTVLSVGPLNRSAASELIDRLQPIGGTTPLTRSIADVADGEGLPVGSNLVVITDGVEECAEDPQGVLRRLRATSLAGLDLSIIGFDLHDDAALTAIRDLADAGGGTFYDASDSTTVSEALRSAFATSVIVRDASDKLVGRGKVDGGWIMLPPGLYMVEIAIASGALVLRDVEIRADALTEVDVKKTGDIVETAVGTPAEYDPYTVCGDGALRRPEVDLTRRIQTKLGRLKIDIGQPDNVVGPATRRGIGEFLDAHELGGPLEVSVRLEQHLDCVLELGAPYAGEGTTR